MHVVRHPTPFLKPASIPHNVSTVLNPPTYTPCGCHKSIFWKYLKLYLQISSLR